MLAEKFIDRLQRQGLLEEKVIAELREQIADSRFVITPEAVAKLLVDNGHLTTFQARKAAWEHGAQKGWSEAPEFFDTNHKFLKDWRNDVGGHFHDSKEGRRWRRHAGGKSTHGREPGAHRRACAQAPAAGDEPVQSTGRGGRVDVIRARLERPVWSCSLLHR